MSMAMVILYADQITGSMERRWPRPTAAAKKQRLQSRKRHHAGKRQEEHRRHSRLGLRARSCPRRYHRRQGMAANEGALMGNNLAAHIAALEKTDARRRHRPRFRNRRALRERFKRLREMELMYADDALAASSTYLPLGGCPQDGETVARPGPSDAADREGASSGQSLLPLPQKHPRRNDPSAAPKSPSAKSAAKAHRPRTRAATNRRRLLRRDPSDLKRQKRRTGKTGRPGR